MNHASGTNPANTSWSRSIFATLLVVLVLAGCNRLEPVPDTPPPVSENCAAECRLPCTTVGIRVDIDPAAPNAFDLLVEQAVVPLRARLQECSDVHRGACVQCLDRLREVGVTR